jgi:transposase
VPFCHAVDDVGEICFGVEAVNGALYAFRGKRGDLVKILWWDGQGLCLFCKRLERGKFLWPQARDGSVLLTTAQLSMLLEGIDWRAPVRSFTPEAAC